MFNLLRFVVVTAAVLAGCKAVAPEEKIDRLRGRFTATATSMVERAPAPGATGDAAAPEPAVHGAGPRRITMLLDVLLSSTAAEPLPGLTLDVYHVDAKGQEKEHRRLFVDSSMVRPGNDVQATLVLEGVSYEEGDQFSAEVRSPVPASERGEYREYTPTG